MVEEEFGIIITKEDGTIVHNEKTKSLPNGFIDFWLPRDENYHIEIVCGDKVAEMDFSTFSGDPTCITTTELS